MSAAKERARERRRRELRKQLRALSNSFSIAGIATDRKDMRLIGTLLIYVAVFAEDTAPEVMASALSSAAGAFFSEVDRLSPRKRTLAEDIDRQDEEVLQ